MKTKSFLSFFLSFFLLLITINPLQSQVRYTSDGNFGIGTSSPSKQLSIKGSNPYIIMEGGSNATNMIRFTEATPAWWGGYIRYIGSSNKLAIGMHNSSSTSTGDDKDIFTMERQYGRIDLYPQSPINYNKSIAVYNRNRLLENYVVYELTDTNPDEWTQTFSVQGRGHVYCTEVHESSDLSLKENIRDISNSISLIKQLRPVTYTLKAEADLAETEREQEIGLIAQEVEGVVPEAVSENSEGFKTINYREVFVLLIDAIKEQQVEIEDLKEQLAELNKTDKKTVGVNTVQTMGNLSEAALYQNSPNPFNQITKIKYYIPDIQISGLINVYDLQGKQLKSFQIQNVGEGEIQISASMFEPGIYIYNLIIDNQFIDTKQMLLTD